MVGIVPVGIESEALCSGVFSEDILKTCGNVHAHFIGLLADSLADLVGHCISELLLGYLRGMPVRAIAVSGGMGLSQEAGDLLVAGVSLELCDSVLNEGIDFVAAHYANSTDNVCVGVALADSSQEINVFLSE